MPAISDASPRIALPYIQPAQAQKHITHNEALARLDLLVQMVVESFDAGAPPATPEIAQIWVLGAAPTGAWAGQAGRLAQWDGADWQFELPGEGWCAFGRAEAELRVFRQGAWHRLLTAGASFDMLGINSAADPNNRLSLAAPATLLSHEGASHRLKINKAGTADTASVLFQSNWTGHAELGLTGDRDLAIKVSLDGSNFTEALRFDAATGQASGTAVQSDARDQSAGRLMRTGAFGLGSAALDDLPAPGNDLDALQTGFAGILADTLNRPTNNGWCMAVSRAGARTQQIAGSADGGPRNDLYQRTQYGATDWTAWSMLYNQSNILGPVSVAAGLPTGALIERGQNANGWFTRFADGTLICGVDQSYSDVNAAAGALFQSSAPASWDFPVSFSAAPTVSGAAGDPARWPALGTSSTSAVAYRVLSWQQASGGGTVTLTAIGRWY